MEWNDEFSSTGLSRKEACDECRKNHSEKGIEPPCDTCRPKYIEENADAIGIFYIVRSQFIMGFKGPIGISYPAVYGAMDLYEIENKRDCFEKILTLERGWLERINDRNGKT